jgi:hypothetical protein
MDYANTFVSEFCNQLAFTQRGIQRMRSWYIFSDRRPGSIVERFELDARSYFEYQKMFQG